MENMRKDKITLHVKIEDILDRYSWDSDSEHGEGKYPIKEAIKDILLAFKECLPKEEKIQDGYGQDFEVGYNQCLKDILNQIDERGER
jgi:hypothetical protein